MFGVAILVVVSVASLLPSTAFLTQRLSALLATWQGPEPLPPPPPPPPQLQRWRTS